MNGAKWLAVARIGVGLWWFESWRHKNKEAWFQRNAGINWAASIAEKHRWPIVKRGFETVVLPRPKMMTYLIVFGELAVGLGLIVGFLTPIAAAAGIALNLMYFTLMIHDWAEQGQNLMMALIEVVVLGGVGWHVWSLDHAIGLFS
jgi:thiosulfate dehydrogenase [quinone] large subunit